MSTSAIRPAHDPSQWGPAIDEAVHVVQRGGLVVLPTDTVYGIGADAFDPDAVAALLAAKGRGRQMPPPVLVGSLATLDGLATDVPDAARALATHFWPGALTLILTAQPSLAWDLGETFGTVALRMPDHPTALALLARTGPMAVSSANRTGSPAAVTAQDAYDQLGASVRVYLDAGDAPGGVASTIVDATGPVLRVVRAGAISLAELNAVAPVEEVPVEPVPAEAVPADSPGEAEPETVAGDQPADPSSEPSTATSPERGDTPG
ncbi:L-threonylcarbamoyladenylate synthase [Sanguibacter suarezii]|uniref:L-threonylcarbamoyladenylate synthase n=1 Tax=Sanguibacter suarezii TaxID=60921 RepID=UPI00082E8683|nr:L-threonylcarbamoyladenylate synthase [Sanguibacter suarezii]